MKRAKNNVGAASQTTLEDAVASLRQLDREVLLARRLDGLSYTEIARRAGLSEAAVQHRMARALYEIDRFMDGVPVRRWRLWPFR